MLIYVLIRLTTLELLESIVTLLDLTAILNNDSWCRVQQLHNLVAVWHVLIRKDKLIEQRPVNTRRLHSIIEVNSNLVANPTSNCLGTLLSDTVINCLTTLRRSTRHYSNLTEVSRTIRIMLFHLASKLTERGFVVHVVLIESCRSLTEMDLHRLHYLAVDLSVRHEWKNGR